MTLEDHPNDPRGTDKKQPSFPLLITPPGHGPFALDWRGVVLGGPG